MDEQARLKILEMIASGKITAAEGVELLASLPKDEADEPYETAAVEDHPVLLDNPPPAAETIISEDQPPVPIQIDHQGPDNEQASNADSRAGQFDKATPPPTKEEHHVPPEAARWQRWWMVPLWIGVGTVVFSGLLMFWAMQSSGLGFWFGCASVPFILGLVVIVLAWQSRSVPWLHLRVQQRPGEWPQTIAISFPIPFQLMAWFFNTFRGRIPGLEHAPSGDMFLAISQNATPENPLYIQVDDDEDGERVEIYIG